MIEDNRPGEVDILVKGITFQNVGNKADVHRLDVVHDGRQISPEGEDDAVNVEHIAHEHRDGGQNQSHADREQEQTQEGKRQQEMIPVQPSAGEDNYSVQRDQRQQEVDADKQAFGKGKDILRDIDLVDQAEVCHHAAHGEVGGFTEIIEIGQADHQVSEVADTRCGELEEVGKDQRHDRHGQDGVQQAPGDAQNAAFILDLEIAADQLLHQKAVFLKGIFQILYELHKTPPHCSYISAYYCCISKGLYEVWAHLCPSKPCLPCKSMIL